MDYSELQQSNSNDDLQQRRQYYQDKSPKELVGMISPVQDYRNVIVIKQLLKEKGVTGIPE